MEKTPERETLERVAEGYHSIIALQAKQKATTAKMIRACLHRLKSTRPTERKEGLDGLLGLAELLEGESARMTEVKPKG